MSLETGSESAEVSESVATETSSAPSESNSGYSATDPGYETGESEDTDLESLIAENKTEKKPSSTEDDASEADGDTEETAKESPVESAAPDGFSDELLDRAAELGYTLDEIKGFRSEKSLEKEITRVETLQKRLQERQTGKKPVKETDPVEETEPEPDWAEMITNGHDPEVVAVNQKMWQRATKAEALVKQVFQAEQDRVIAAQTERFDETLNKIEGFEEILGSGNRGEMLKASPDHAANRQKVFTKMLVLRRGYEEAGEKIPSESELIQEAVQASFYKHSQTTARAKLKSDIKKAGSQALSRPNSAGAKPLSGAPAAAAKEDVFWKKFRS